LELGAVGDALLSCPDCSRKQLEYQAVLLIAYDLQAVTALELLACITVAVMYYT
jgi:hypothetical protein